MPDVGHGLERDPKDPPITNEHREHIKKEKERDKRADEEDKKNDK